MLRRLLTCPAGAELVDAQHYSCSQYTLSEHTPYAQIAARFCSIDGCVTACQLPPLVQAKICDQSVEQADFKQHLSRR